MVLSTCDWKLGSLIISGALSAFLTGLLSCALQAVMRGRLSWRWRLAGAPETRALQPAGRRCCLQRPQLSLLRPRALGRRTVRPQR